MEPVIRIRNLEMAYDQRPVLSGIDLDVAPGEILGYLGPNGAGKTTTVKILIGLLPDFGGEVRVCGLDVRRDPLAVKRRIGYVPESAALYEVLTPLEQLELVGRIHGMRAERIEPKARALLELVGLADEAEAPLASFSKGMRQKVLIIAALLHDPEVLFLDEPLTGLDASAAVTMKEIFSRLAQRGRTLFYCSHVMDVVERVCDRIVILSGGRVLADASFEELRDGSDAASLEHLFTELTSDGRHAEVAAEFVRVLEGQDD